MELKWGYWDLRLVVIDSANKFSLLRTEVDLLEYAGVQDKDGRTIFEWDIIECTQIHEGMPYTQRGFVIFDKWSYWWDFSLSEEKLILNTVVEARNWKIVWNIYESPESLHNNNPNETDKTHIAMTSDESAS